MIQWLNANVWNFKPCVEYTVLCCWYNTIQIYVHGFVNNYAFIISVSSANLNNGVTPPMMMYPPLAIIYYFVLFLLHGLNHIHHFSMNRTKNTLRYHLLQIRRRGHQKAFLCNININRLTINIISSGHFEGTFMHTSYEYFYRIE